MTRDILCRVARLPLSGREASLCRPIVGTALFRITRCTSGAAAAEQGLAEVCRQANRSGSVIRAGRPDVRPLPRRVLTAGRVPVGMHHGIQNNSEKVCE